MNNFLGFVQKVIEHITASGTRDVQCPWSTFETTLEFSDEQQVASCQPDEKFMEFGDYVKAWGDPSTNGKGHHSEVFSGQVDCQWHALTA